MKQHHCVSFTIVSAWHGKNCALHYSNHGNKQSHEQQTSQGETVVSHNYSDTVS